MDAGIALTVVGVLVALAIWRHQERKPILAISVSQPPDGDPTSLTCQVTNSGRAESRDLRIGFNRMLPCGTEVIVAPEVGARIERAPMLPHPGEAPNASRLQLAFAVVIGRIPPKTTVSFSVRTLDPDNGRAGVQMTKLQGAMKEALVRFGECLDALYGARPDGWDLDLVMSAHKKQQSFFWPGFMAHEVGRAAVPWLTDAEQMALAVHQDYYSRHKKECSSAFDQNASFKAPVVRIEASDGPSTYAVMPPYINTFITGAFSAAELKAKKRLAITPPVPDTYD